MIVVSCVKNNIFFTTIILIFHTVPVTVGFKEASVLSLLAKSARDQNGTKCLELLREIDNGLQDNAIWAYKCMNFFIP